MLYAYLCREIKRNKESKKFDTFQPILHSAPGNTWPAPSLCSELWSGVIPHFSAPWLILSSSLGNRDISATELSALAHCSSSCQAQHSSVRQWAVSPVVPRLSHRAKARKQEQEFEPRTEQRGQAPAPIAALSWGAWAACLGWLLVPSWLAVPFLLIWCPGATFHSFLGQNSFWQIFFLCLIGMEELWKLLQIEFCSSITVKAASQQTCWMSASQACGWQLCHVRPHMRDPPTHSLCVGKGCALIGKPRFLPALWPLSVKASH